MVSDTATAQLPAASTAKAKISYSATVGSPRLSRTNGVKGIASSCSPESGFANVSTLGTGRSASVRLMTVMPTFRIPLPTSSSRNRRRTQTESLSSIRSAASTSNRMNGLAVSTGAPDWTVTVTGGLRRVRTRRCPPPAA